MAALLTFFRRGLVDQQADQTESTNPPTPMLPWKTGLCIYTRNIEAMAFRFDNCLYRRNNCYVFDDSINGWNVFAIRHPKERKLVIACMGSSVGPGWAVVITTGVVVLVCNTLMCVTSRSTQFQRTEDQAHVSRRINETIHSLDSTATMYLYTIGLP